MLKYIKVKYIVPGTIIFIAVFLFLLLGPPGLLEYSDSPEFCNSCHVMNSEFEEWFLAGLHRNIKCVDCHLPNNSFLSHYIWKSIDGMKDVIFFYGYIYSEMIVSTTRGKNTIQENCASCHNEMVSRINVEGRKCWDCHRRVNHRVIDFALGN